MTATVVPGPGKPASDALRCSACVRPLGSVVAFCPFCGRAQVKAAPASSVPLTRPVLLTPVPTPVTPVATPVTPVPLAGTPVPPVKFVPPSSPAKTQVQPLPAAPGRTSGPVPATPASVWFDSVVQTTKPPVARPLLRKSVRRVVGSVAVLLIALFLLRGGFGPAAKATLVVHVHAANGVALTGGHIVVDDRDVGSPGESITVTPGDRQVSFEDSGWRSALRHVSVANGATETVELTAQELPSHLEVITSPAGAVIRIRNKSYGPSPVNADLSPGSYDLSVTLNGYVSKVLPLTLIRGESRTVHIDLAPGQAAPPRVTPAPFDRGVVTAATPLQTSPAANADAVAILPPVSEVQVVGQAAVDEPWLQVRAMGRQGYVRAGVVEPWDSWADHNGAKGTIDAVTSGLKVVIGGNAYPLAGVQLPDRGASVAGLGRVSASLGGLLKGADARCTPLHTTNFQCKTAEGRDIGELYLLNGGAVVGEGALPYYAEAQRAAHDKQKGLWSE